MEKEKGPPHPSEKKSALEIDDSYDEIGGSKGERARPAFGEKKGPPHPSEKKSALGIDDSYDEIGGSKGERARPAF